MPAFITSLLSRDGEWHTWEVRVNGLIRRRGWTMGGRLEAAREAAKDVAELTAIEKRRSDAERDQVWTPNDAEVANV